MAFCSLLPSRNLTDHSHPAPSACCRVTRYQMTTVLESITLGSKPEREKMVSSALYSSLSHFSIFLTLSWWAKVVAGHPSYFVAKFLWVTPHTYYQFYILKFERNLVIRKSSVWLPIAQLSKPLTYLRSSENQL